MITISTFIQEELITESLNTFPDESCGFLFGTEQKDERIITKILPVNNVKEGDKRRRFEISASDYIHAEKYADDSGLNLIGIYHSHPNHPSVPSETDRLFAQPYFSYIIISVKENEFVSIQSWKLNDYHQFDEEHVLFTNTQLKTI